MHRGNYAVFLEQVDPITTSVGAWRAGPEDEIFVRSIRLTSLIPFAFESTAVGMQGRYGRCPLHATGTLAFIIGKSSSA